MPISRAPTPDGSTRRILSGRLAGKTINAPSSPSATRFTAGGEAAAGRARTRSATTRIDLTGTLKPEETPPATADGSVHPAAPAGRRPETKEEDMLTTRSTASR